VGHERAAEIHDEAEVRPLAEEGPLRLQDADHSQNLCVAHDEQEVVRVSQLREEVDCSLNHHDVRDGAADDEEGEKAGDDPVGDFHVRGEGCVKYSTYKKRRQSALPP